VADFFASTIDPKPHGAIIMPMTPRLYDKASAVAEAAMREAFAKEPKLAEMQIEFTGGSVGEGFSELRFILIPPLPDLKVDVSEADIRSGNAPIGLGIRYRDRSKTDHFGKIVAKKFKHYWILRNDKKLVQIPYLYCWKVLT
jgi:hypothetical protein